jgi:hypothetical protein
MGPCRQAHHGVEIWGDDQHPVQLSTILSTDLSTGPCAETVRWALQWPCCPQLIFRSYTDLFNEIHNFFKPLILKEKIHET